MGSLPRRRGTPYWPRSQVLGELHGPSGGSFLDSLAPVARAGFFGAVVDAIAEATADRPALLIVEDVHWADEGSLALLRFLIGALPGLRVVLAVSARDDPSEYAPGAAEALEGLPPAVLRVPLQGLDRQATGVLFEQVNREAISARFAAEMHDRTGGNPFFVIEVARLHRSGSAAAASTIPPGVRHVLRRRLARLPQAASEVLIAAAVLGERCDIEVLAAVTGLADDDLRAQLDEAARARLGVSSSGTWEFAHALVREALYEDQGQSTLARLHRLAAETLEAHAATSGSLDSDERSAALAVHWMRAGPDARRRVAALAFAAAESAMARMGYEQAVRLLPVGPR